MPTNRTRRRRRWVGDDPEDYKRYRLCMGLRVWLQEAAYYPRHWTFPEPPTPEEVAIARENMQPDWERRREEILAIWTGEVPMSPSRGFFKELEPPGPGHRPWAWWEFDAPRYGERMAHEDEAEFIERFRLWRPGERTRYKIAHPDFGEA